MITRRSTATFAIILVISIVSLGCNQKFLDAATLQERARKSEQEACAGRGEPRWIRQPFGLMFGCGEGTAFQMVDTPICNTKFELMHNAQTMSGYSDRCKDVTKFDTPSPSQ